MTHAELLNALTAERQDLTFWRLPTTVYQQAAEDRAIAFRNITEADAVPVRIAELLDAVGAELDSVRTQAVDSHVDDTCDDESHENRARTEVA